MYLTASAVLVVCCCIAVEATNTCYATDPNPYLEFGSKTAYSHVYNKDGIQVVPDCQPVQLWMVARHGTRWPDKEDADKLFSKLINLRTQIFNNRYDKKVKICEDDIENLGKWNTTITQDQGYMLTEGGKKEVYGLGQRIRRYFPSLFNGSYSTENFKFQHTDTTRTKESAQYFFRGIFRKGFNERVQSLPDAQQNDRLIDPYNNCPVWARQSKAAKKHRAQFYQGPEMTELIKNVKERLGINNLTMDDISDMYDGCRYEKAWKESEISAWCAVFTRDELVILEYSEDLNYYHRFGPGNEINLKMANKLAHDLYTKFSEVQKNPGANHPKAVVYFTHAKMVYALWAHLGLAGNSQPLTPNNFQTQSQRKFRNTQIIPFAGNLIAVLYRCSNGQQKTIFYEAEKEVEYPGCRMGLCNWIEKKEDSLKTKQLNDEFCN